MRDAAAPAPESNLVGKTVLREMEVDRVEDVAEMIREFVLTPRDGQPVESFSAGAHVECEVILPNGDTGLRAYSLVNAPAEMGCYRIAVARSDDGRGGSLFMHSVKPGDTIRVGRPRNDFPLTLSAKDLCSSRAGSV